MKDALQFFLDNMILILVALYLLYVAKRYRVFSGGPAFGWALIFSAALVLAHLIDILNSIELP